MQTVVNKRYHDTDKTQLEKISMSLVKAGIIHLTMSQRLIICPV